MKNDTKLNRKKLPNSGDRLNIRRLKKIFESFKMNVMRGTIKTIAISFILLVVVFVVLKEPNLIILIANAKVFEFPNLDVYNVIEAVKKIQVDRGAFASFFGISIACYYASVQIRKRAASSKDDAIQSHMIAVSYFAEKKRALKGIYCEDTKNHRYIAMWRVVCSKNLKYKEYKLVILFRICLSTDIVLDDIREGNIDLWWDHKLIIPRFGEKHGIVVESFNEKRTTDFICNIPDKERTSIMRAMKSIQLLDERGISDCKERLSSSFLKQLDDVSLVQLEPLSIPRDH